MATDSKGGVLGAPRPDLPHGAPYGPCMAFRAAEQRVHLESVAWSHRASRGIIQPCFKLLTLLEWRRPLPNERFEAFR